MKKIKNYLLAFFIPLLICVVFLYFKGILTNIEYMYVSDLRLQHISFLNYLKNILLGNTSVFYTFTAGMGSPMISTLIFYSISPINILLTMFNDIRYALLFVYIIKLSFAGLTMYILLKNKTAKDNFMTVVFSTCYALCAFVINYFFCIFWFDAMYLAPLVILGIDRMFKTKKISLLYILALALAIICNIQMGFGLCVFAVIYYFYSFNINYNIKKDFKMFINFGIIFAIASLCAGAISSGFLLGFLDTYKDVAASRSIGVTTKAGATDFGHILKNLFVVGNYKQEYFNAYEPFINCGLLVSFFAILYLFNSNIDKKKRFHALGVILVFVLSFCIGPFNLFWHLTEPVLLNFRYSVYLGLFLTIIAYEGYISQNKLNHTNMAVLAVTLIMGLIIVISYKNEIYIGYTLAFLIAMALLIFLTKNISKKFEILLAILVFLELGFNGYLSLYTCKELPINKYSSYDSLKELAAKNNFDDNYRVLYDYSYTDLTNDTLLLNKNSSLRYFSSVINGNVNKFFVRTGSNAGNNNYHVSAYDSPLLLSLMGNKYFYLTKEFDSSIYKKIDTYNIKSYDYEKGKMDTKPVYLYKNPYALSLGYVIENDYDYRESLSIADYQNNIIQAFLDNEDDVLLELDYDVISDDVECLYDNTYYSCKSYSIQNDVQDLTYIYTYFTEYIFRNNATAYLDGVKPLVISSPDDNINMIFKYNGDLDLEPFEVLTYDETVLINDLNELKKNSLYNIKIDKNIMKAKLKSDKDGILFLSIPYNDKFKIYVDNKEVSYYPVLDNAFIGLDIAKGKHDVKLVYVDNNLILYVLCSLGSLAITIVLYFIINKIIDKKIEQEKRRRILEEEKNKKKPKSTKKKKKRNK